MDSSAINRKRINRFQAMSNTLYLDTLLIKYVGTDLTKKVWDLQEENE